MINVLEETEKFFDDFDKYEHKIKLLLDWEINNDMPNLNETTLFDSPRMKKKKINKLVRPITLSGSDGDALF
jgi:hypothetical protein